MANLDKETHPPGVGEFVPEVEASLDYMGVDAYDPEENTNWLRRARDAYNYSTTYVDSNYRKQWEDSIRAFNNQHPLDSKYNQPAFDKRSKIYRPKPRSVIRKNEAAAAAAFFSNMDVISTDARNQSDPLQRASADVMKELLGYRLGVSIPWFQTVMGALQDAQTQGAVCAHVYWHYEDGYKPVDKPCVDLIPIENMRIDPSASWIDPVGTSPYLIHLIPMYVGDVKRRMMKPDKRGIAWKQYSDGVIKKAMQQMSDSTRITRNSNREDPADTQSQSVGDYEIVWVQRHIHRKDGRDWHFWTLWDLALLTDPEPLEAVVFTGERPYVIGTAIIETHKSLASSVPSLMRELVTESNEIANQRIDNVRFVLNKAYRVKRGANVDVAALVRNAPGRVIMTNNPQEDIVEESWPDVTASSYQEQERIDNDLNELMGNFSPMDLPNRKGAETARGMQLLTGPSMSLTEYLLRTFAETFVEPVLRMLVKLEQYYETDQTVLAIVAAKAKLWQRYGVNRVTDSMLSQDLTLRVNVGMGATDPNMKLAKLVQGFSALTEIAKNAPPWLNVGEIGKEIAGFMGYQDGARFLSNGGNADPQVAVLQSKIQAMEQMMHMAEAKLQDKQSATQAQLASAQLKARTDLVLQQQQHQHENRQMLAEAQMERDKQGPQENPELQMALEREKLSLERYKADQQARIDMQQAVLDAQTKREIAMADIEAKKEIARMQAEQQAKVDAAVTKALGSENEAAGE